MGGGEGLLGGRLREVERGGERELEGGGVVEEGEKELEGEERELGGGGVVLGGVEKDLEGEERY